MKKLSSEKKKWFYRIAILVGVIAIPLAYSLFYLGAFWDPYSRLSNLPVAVVNNDAGAQVNGKARNLGNELADRLRIDDSLKWVITDQKDGKAGVDGNKYYAMVVIPGDFSASIASAETTDKKTALVTYEANDKRNYLATQIFHSATLNLELELRADVNRELTQELVGKLKDVPDNLSDLSDGLGKIKDGSGKLTDGASDLVDGQKKLVSGSSDLKSGLSDLSSGAKTLNSNMGALDSGLGQVASGASTLSAGAAQLPALSKGISDLDSGVAALQSGTHDYVAGTNQLISQSRQVAAALSSYVSRNPSAASDPALGPLLSQLSSSGSQLATLETSGTAMITAVSQVKGGADILKENSSGLGSLSTGLVQLSGSISQLKDGSAQLYAGETALVDGVQNAQKGSSELLSGEKQAKKGASQLQDGAGELQGAIGTAQQRVDDSISNANTDLKKTDGLDDFAAEPIKVENTTANSIPNYGTAFSPYFVSLSIWVGALIMLVGIYLDPEQRMPMLSSSSNRKFIRKLVFILISIVQSCLLAFLVMGVLHLQVSNVLAFYGACILVSLAFTSIVEFLIVHVGNIGKFLAVLFLVLQLTACGGTFPMETVPSFFNVIYPYMPMTYSVNLFKKVISGGYALSDILVLASIFVVFTCASLAFSLVKRKKANQTLKVAI